MELIYTIFLYFIAFFVAFGVGGLSCIPLAVLLVKLGRTGAFVLSTIQGMATAWIAIAIFHWAERDYTWMMLILLLGIFWNDLFRRGLLGAILTTDWWGQEANPLDRLKVQLETLYLLGDILGVGCGWYFSGWIIS